MDGVRWRFFVDPESMMSVARYAGRVDKPFGLTFQRRGDHILRALNIVVRTSGTSMNI